MPSKKKALVPKFEDVSLASLHGFAGLGEVDQDTVLKDHKALLILRHHSRYEMGERLKRIQKILKPLRLYEVYLKTALKESRATANRAVAYYDRIQALPAAVRQIVVERSLNLSPKRIEAFPPPETNDPEEIETWITVQETGGRKVEVQAPHDTPEIMLKQNLRDIRRNLRKLPRKYRGQYVEQICGMVLNLGGMSAQRIEPVPVPDSFFALGRPRIEPPDE